ncbi:PRC-barrel domain-containing protein [Chryseobacterium indoltheticum]|uniref:Uncharacterized protein conserved in bacteria n=1 Tax=Chryseobacterium indoltheticum TaxID=254 RepID=A0A381FHU8_9FLAO|nr:PRC-barrel domain-containing protein [Chryseobacterium indoltheticum]SUX46043.1 Uncharacterized protein conserved in bacteria [Chryseobacterium indoltheticum]
MALEQNKYTHLVELGGSDYEIVDGEPDIRGWDVKNRSGIKIGEIDELLFNPDSLKVRYMVVDVDKNELNIEQKKILVPIGTAVLYNDGRLQDNDVNEERNTIDADERMERNEQIGTQSYVERTTYNPSDDGKVVVVPITAEHISWLPAYERDNLNPHTEVATRRAFLGLNDPNYRIDESEYSAEEFYNHEHFNEEKFYNTRTRSNLKRKL